MTTLRFGFQLQCARKAIAELTGPVLNVGANEDPAHIKSVDPGRVLNCDLFDRDEVMGRPNAVDVLFDCARDPWPFADGEAALVIFGDILEHLTPAEMAAALQEARRVSRWLCVTVPEDPRETTSDEEADKYPRGAVHRTIVTEDLLRSNLDTAGWAVTSWETVDYGFVPRGFFVTAS